MIRPESSGREFVGITSDRGSAEKVIKSFGNGDIIVNGSSSDYTEVQSAPEGNYIYFFKRAEMQITEELSSLD